jgi:hypothetical protein
VELKALVIDPESEYKKPPTMAVKQLVTKQADLGLKDMAIAPPLPFSVRHPVNAQVSMFDAPWIFTLRNIAPPSPWSHVILKL